MDSNPLSGFLVRREYKNGMCVECVGRNRDNVFVTADENAFEKTFEGTLEEGDERSEQV